MTRLRKILAYVESADPDSLAPVIALAERHGARLTLCDVIGMPPEHGTNKAITERLNSLCWRQAFERLRGLTEKYRSRVELDTTILVGEAFIAITEQVLLEAYDMVVHITDRDGDSSHTGLDPVGMHLARKCPCLVWSLRAGGDGLPRNIVVAVDRQHRAADPDRDALPTRLISTAAAILHPEGELTVVHTWEPYGEHLLASERAGIPEEQASQYVAAIEQEHRAWLDALLQTAAAQENPVSVEGRLLRGPVSSTVSRVAEDLSADLIVMGNIGTSRIPGILIGMSAEAVLLGTRTPVLLVKAPDFTTPLRLAQSTNLSTASEQYGRAP